jgi:hypothetical protein
MNSYFKQSGFISNSDLSAFKKLVNLAPEMNLSRAYNMGNMVEAMIQGECSEEYEAQAEKSEIETARLIVEAGLADPTLKLFLEGAKIQHEVYRQNFPVEYEGQEIAIPFRAKLDILKKQFRAGADIKTTACTNKDSFVQSIFHFDYDRQAAVYMDAARLDSFMFIGLSKKRNRISRKHEVYKFAIMRNDASYTSGKAKFNYLAFNYYYKIHSLNLNL